MNAMIIINIVIKSLDFLHDLLCPFFRDDKQNNEEKQEILNKIKELEKQLSLIQKRKDKQN